MGRFFRTARPEFLQGTQYNAPIDLMMQVIQNDNNLRSTLEQNTAKTEYELLNTPHLSFDKDLLKEVQKGYTDSINDLTQSIYNDVNIVKTAKPKMKELQMKLTQDRLNGKLGAIQNRYNSFSKFQEENKGLKDTDPYTYNIALNYELNKLKESTSKDPLATFNSYKIQGTPNFRKEVVDEINKLKASSKTIPDGKGYLIKVKDLSYDRIMDLAVSNVLSRPEYKEFARQQTMYGLSGFQDANGNPITPFSYVNSEGKLLSKEDITNLSTDDRLKLKRIINTNWRFGNEINQLANSFAYRESDMTSDGTWTAKMREAGANSRHNANLAFDREKFAYQKQKDAAELELKLRELNGNGSSNNSSGGGGKANSYSGVKDGLASGNSLDGYQDTLNFANDLSDINSGNSAVLSRLQKVQSSLLSNKALRSTTVGNDNLGRVSSNLINKGVDLSRAEDEEFRNSIINEIKLRSKDGRIKIGNTTYFINNQDHLKSAAKDLAELIQDNTKYVVENSYKTFNQTTNSAEGFPISSGMSSRILDQAFHSPEKVKMVDAETGRALSQEEMKYLLNGNNEIRMYRHPGANSRYGGAVTMNLVNEDLAKQKRAKRYIITGADFEDRPNQYSKNELLRGIEQSNDTSIANSDLSMLYYAKRNAGLNTISNHDLKRVSPTLGNKVDKISIGNNSLSIRLKDNTIHSIPTYGSPEEQLYALEQYLLTLGN